MLLVADGGHCGLLRQRVDVERLPHPVEHRNDFGVGQRVADAQTGQPENLGKRPGHDHLRVFQETPGRRDRIAVFGIGFVQHDQYMRRQRLDQSPDLVVFQHGAGRVVRVGDEHHGRGLVHAFEQRLRVVPQRLLVLDRVWGRNPCRGACRLHHQRIDHEGVPREHGAAARFQVGARDQVQQVGRTVAEDQAVGRAVVPDAQRFSQRVSVVVGVAGQVGRLPQGGHRLGGWAKRILVGSQAADLLVHGAGPGAGHVGGQALHAGACGRDDVPQCRGIGVGNGHEVNPMRRDKSPGSCRMRQPRAVVPVPVPLRGPSGGPGCRGRRCIPS